MPESKSRRLCLAGLQARHDGRHEEASMFFHQAWVAATDSYDAALAAHEFADSSGDPLVALPWHLRALDVAYSDDQAKDLRASLHRSLGECYAALGERDEAEAELQRASRAAAAAQPATGPHDVPPRLK